MKFSRKFLNTISMALSITMVLLMSLIFSFIENSFNSINQEKALEVIAEKTMEDEIPKNDESTKVSDSKNDQEKPKEEYDWYIEIPEIGVYAPIEEGTSDEILNRSIGHFENTSRRNGNCGLAAHNRGYSVNYFSRLKELKNGDKIYYFVDGKKYKYEIDKILIIYETDWSMLENTKEDKITLITCVEDRPEYRLCVQGSLSLE